MLLLELDPLRSEGRPRLKTDDFFCAETRAGEERLKGCVEEVLALERAGVDES